MSHSSLPQSEILFDIVVNNNKLVGMKEKSCIADAFKRIGEKEKRPHCSEALACYRMELSCLIEPVRWFKLRDVGESRQEFNK